MYRLSDDLPFVNLALSLHAPNQEVRLKIVPTARAVSIEKLLEAVDYHIMKNTQYIELEKGKEPSPEEKISQPIEMDGNWKTARTSGVMIEYILIRDVNDKTEHAEELARLLAPRRRYVMLNLIPYNPTEVAEDFQPPLPEQVETFMRTCIAEPYSIHTRVRQEKGQDIAGACGQLAVVTKKAEEKRLTDLEDTGMQATASSSLSQKESCDSKSGECCSDGQGCMTPSKTSKASNETTPGKSAFLEEVLGVFGISSHQPVDNNKEGINISDNSPVQENTAHTAIQKERSSFLVKLLPVGMFVSAVFLARWK